MRRLLGYVIHGVGYGAFSYLVLVSLLTKNFQFHPQDTFVVLLMSAGIGGLTVIFDSDRLSGWRRVGLHFLMTLVIVLLTQQLTHVFYQGRLSWHFIVIFLLTYLFVWIIIFLNQSLQVDRVNRVLAAKRRQK